MKGKRGACVGKRQRHSSFLFPVVLVCLLAALAALFLFGHTPGENGTPLQQRGDANKRYLMDGGLERDGKIYRSKDEVTSLLIFGVSHEDAEDEMPAYARERYVSFAQLFLVDHGTKRICRVPVDSDVLANIRVPDGFGKTVLQQGPLAYAFGAGDGAAESCRYVTEAVAGLLPDGRIDFYLSVEADNLRDLLRIAADIVNQAMPLEESTEGRLTGRKARGQLQSQQMAQLITLITHVSSKDEEQINRLFDAMMPYVQTDMPRGRMINEVWQMKHYPFLDKWVLPVGENMQVQWEEAKALCLSLFYQEVE